MLFYRSRRRNNIGKLTSKSAAQRLRERVAERPLAERIAADFEEFLDNWHAAPETFDNELDALIHRWYYEILSKRQYFDFKAQPYFSPSSANSCQRELYEKLRGAKRDQTDIKPYQGRWQRIGTAIGDIIQRDILFAEKHYERVVGEKPRFRFERTPEGYPMFEEFAKSLVPIEYDGQKFALYGTCDGVMLYTTDDGELLRVGLEVKSKQTSYSKTNERSMNEAMDDHYWQATAYSIMYDLDYYIILYVNASKKAWVMTDEEYRKNPDRRAFGIEISKRAQDELLDRFASVVKAARDEKPPKLELDKWTFNNYKTACALSLTDEELVELRAWVGRVWKSQLPDWRKAQYVEALEFIEEVRNGIE